MYVGHGRGAVFGDALAALLVSGRVRGAASITSTTPAPRSASRLARSTHLRYQEALGETFDTILEGLYPGEYLIETGKALAARDGKKWLGKPEAEWLRPIGDFAIAAMMDLIRDDLAAIGISFDKFVSDRSLVAGGAVDDCVSALDKAGLLYTGVLEPPKGKLPDDWEPRPQTLFRATNFGDEVDRPLKKSDGSWTYFAADIAYHRDNTGAALPI